MPLPNSFTVDTAARRVRLDPAELAFFKDPYPAYDAIRASAPAFFWEDYGFWCFSGHEQVAALFRDKRFGRDVLGAATRADLGWPEPPSHTAPFRAVEAHSMLELEPPAHTRLRTL